jgi:hypothetical protein
MTPQRSGRAEQIIGKFRDVDVILARSGSVAQECKASGSRGAD